MIDLSNSMCLACSSSIQSAKHVVHVTKCCDQAICDSCMQSNPRLATYDPCLACLNGINASRGRTLINQITIQSKKPTSIISNDENVFVLGCDSDDEETKGQEELFSRGPSRLSPSEPPTYEETVDSCIKEDVQSSTRQLVTDGTSPVSNSGPSVLSASAHNRYYINARDTIHGIALRFGVDARKICQRNSLPFSTLNTTPHLLHTRTFLELPLSSKPIPLQYVLSQEDQANREAHRAKERAEKRLQMVTKEVDWHVAKAYVSLAESPDNGLSVEKRKESTLSGSFGGDLAIRAVDMYLDDEEWERNEINAGHSSSPRRLPRPAKAKGAMDLQTK